MMPLLKLNQAASAASTDVITGGIGVADVTVVFTRHDAPDDAEVGHADIAGAASAAGTDDEQSLIIEPAKADGVTVAVENTADV